MDADPRVRQAAIRVSEPQLTEGDATIISALGKTQEREGCRCGHPGH